MLHIFRQKDIRRNVLWFITGVIILSFGFLGSVQYSHNFTLADAAGKAFGQKISIKEFKKNYQDTYDQAVMMHGENLRKIEAYLNLEGETWTRIILSREATSKGIKASDLEVVGFIQKIPFFQRDGGFDQTLYENVLEHVFRREARDFEEGIRSQIKIMKLLQTATMGLTVQDDVVRKEYERRNQKIQVSYILIDPSDLKSAVTADEGALRSYYDAHRSEFLTPDAVKITYVTIPANNATQADTLYNDASKNNDLAMTAKAAGLTSTTTEFIDMETPDMNVGWSLELLQKIFEAKKGTILAPEKIAEDLQILQITDTRPAMIPEFEKAKEMVQARLIADKTAELAQAKAAKIQEQLGKEIASGAAFSDIAKTLGFTAKTTPFFALGDYIPEIGLSEDFQTAASALNKDQRLSQVVITAKGPAILYWNNTEAIDENKFIAEKKTFADSLYQEEYAAVVSRTVKEIKDRAKLENYLDKIKK